MRMLFIGMIQLLLGHSSQAQNTGIGITTPRAKLHVFNGASGNTTPYSPMVVESNGHTYINLLSPDANETSILFGKASDAASGGIVYNNTATPNGLQFRTNGNNNRMFILDNGNVGIGNSNPNAPLGFPMSYGKKITLYPSGLGDIGFGVQSNLLQIYSNGQVGDIAFGYDQSGTFTEKFRIKGNGGIVLSGNTGSAGQVLQSNGSGAATWGSPTNLLYSNTILLENGGTITLNSENEVPLPGLTYSFTASSFTKVLVNFSIPSSSTSCVFCGPTTLGVNVAVNGAVTRRFQQDIVNGSKNVLTGTTYFQVGPGSHTISISAYRYGPDVIVGGGILTSHAVVQIIPQ